MHFFQLAQRAQTHVEDRFCLPVGQAKLGHHHWLGFVLGADNLDHPVEIEEGDDIALDQFQPPRDLVKPMLRAALQNLKLRTRPMLEQLFEAHHHRRSGRIEHVHIEREARFHIGEFEDALFQKLGVDIAAARDQHNADLLVRFVTHIVQNRQLLVRNRLRDLLDQFALLHLIGNF